MKAGERVLARNEYTGEQRYQPVVQSFSHGSGAVYTLHLHASRKEVPGQATSDRLSVTAEHPFWVKGKGWSEAKDLKTGAEVASASGTWLVVESLQREPGEQKTYNLEVAEDHSFFVGDAQAWVHNGCLEKVVARNSGQIVEGGAQFATRRQARQAASEMAGNLGSDVQAIRMRDFRQANVPWGLKNSNRVIGKQSADGLFGWRDDFLGHPQFQMGSHVNVWTNGSSFHFFYGY